MKDSKKRFSDRVENYVKYRPHYPKELLKVLQKEIELNNKWVIADIGSGTGISSELFIDNGNTVYGIEPNKEMRNAAENIFSRYKKFISINGSAENTSLNDNSVDLVISGQALHWFDKKRSKIEFKRILKDNGFTIFFWNERNTSSGFLKEYEKILKTYCIDYGKVTQKKLTLKDFESFYGNNNFIKEKIKNSQKFNFEGLKGRLHSSSYSPNNNEPIYNKMISALKEVFNNFSINDEITFNYDTEIYIGKIS